MYLNGTTVAPNTERNYRNAFRLDILPALGAKRLHEITRNDAKRLIARMRERDLAKDTIRMTLANLSRVFTYAIEEEGWPLKNPAERSGRAYREAPKRHDEINPLTAEEVPLFLQTILVDPIWREHYTLFLCGLHTGLRPGELAGLKSG